MFQAKLTNSTFVLLQLSQVILATLSDLDQRILAEFGDCAKVEIGNCV
jgi:hypothetical protein